MHAVGADRMSWKTSYGEIAIRLVDDQYGARMEIVKRSGPTETVVAFRPEWLQRLVCGVQECQRLLTGHEKHQGKVDPVLVGKK